MNFHDAFQNKFGSAPAIMDISYENLFTPTNIIGKQKTFNILN